MLAAGFTRPSTASLPMLPWPLVGRERDTIRARQWLIDEDARLVTLTGPPGVGKTSLGLSVCGGLGGEFSDGVHFIDLSSLVEPEQVAVAIGDALELPAGPFLSASERVAVGLADRELLLLLDNFEHLMPAASFVSILLNRCPSIRVLVTSRAPLRIRGERELPVAPLSFAQGHDGGAAPAVTLFLERARAVSGDLVSDGADDGVVAELCRRLDGLPLAIELAAARTRLLPPKAMLQQLTSRSRLRHAPPLRVLADGPRDLPLRQQTLRNAIDWSHALLNEVERRLFRRLAVFAGGCTFEAAAIVCPDVPGVQGGVSADQVFDGLASLVEKSLIRRETLSGGEVRLRMLETIREFGVEQLDASGEAAEVAARHSRYFVELAEQAEPLLAGPNSREWLDRLQRERDNLRLVTERSVDLGDAETMLRIGAALWRFWWIRSTAEEARERLTAVLDASARLESHPTTPRALHGAGILARQLGDLESAEAVLSRALQLACSSGDQLAEVLILGTLGHLLVFRGAEVRARELLERAIAIAERLDERAALAAAQVALSFQLFHQGEPSRARSLASQALIGLRGAGDRRAESTCLLNVGIYAMAEHDLDGALESIEAALAIARSIDYAQGVAQAMDILGDIRIEQGELELARECYLGAIQAAQFAGDRRRLALITYGVASWAAKQNLGEVAVKLAAANRTAMAALGASLAPSFAKRLVEILAEPMRALGERAEPADREGARMSLDQAVDFAIRSLAGLVPPAWPASSSEVPITSVGSTAEQPHGLTPRETEVARLLSLGWTNRQIAKEMTVSPGAIANYVQRVMNKLGLHTRAQVAVWAVAHGLGPSNHR